VLSVWGPTETLGAARRLLEVFAPDHWKDRITLVWNELNPAPESCFEPGDTWSVRARWVDHVQPVRTHPDLAFEPGNLQTLCPACHTRKTRIECGHPAPDPKRAAWREAVASLAAKPNEHKEMKNA